MKKIEVVLIGASGSRTTQITPRGSRERVWANVSKSMATEPLAITPDPIIPEPTPEPAANPLGDHLNALIVQCDAILDPEPVDRRETVQSAQIRNGLAKVAKTREERLVYEKRHNVAERRKQAIAKAKEMGVL